MMALKILAKLLASLEPRLQPGAYVFVCVPALPVGLEPIASFREAEGLTLVVEESAAHAAGLTPLFRAAWITLTVHSDLAAVGLTAAVSTALAECGIACNVIAAAHHDHLFVPVERADVALAALVSLAEQARRA